MDASVRSIVFYITIVLYLSSGGQVLCSSRWVLSVQVAQSWMSGFTGAVNVCLTFSPNNTAEDYDLPERSEADRHCLTLPWHRFERGQTYSTAFESNTTEESAANVANVWTLPPSGREQSHCESGSSDRLRLASFTVHSLKTGWKFSSAFSGGNWRVPRACDGHLDSDTLELEASVAPRPCPSFDGDGSVYSDGETFQVGCRMQCKCEDGDVGCKSMCPPYQAPGCSRVYEPGECCARPTCSPGSCVTAEENDCEASNRTVSLGEVPWATFIKTCDANDTNRCERACSGSLVSENWVLTSLECVRGALASQVRLIVGELTIVVAEDAEVEIVAEEVHQAPGGAGLALVKLSSSVDPDRTVQPVALPPSREECLQLTEPSCAVVLSGWVSSTADSGASPSYELYKLSSHIEDGGVCGPVPRRPKKRKDPGHLCVSLTDDEIVVEDVESDEQQVTGGWCANEKRSYLCSEQQGLGLVSKAMDPGWNTGVNFLIGVVSYNLPVNVTTEQMCNRPAYRLAIGVCNHLHWISTTINGGP